MSTLAEEMQIQRLSLTDTHLHIYLKNKLVVTAPLDIFPKLSDATEEALANWKITSDGIGARWDELGVEISLPKLLGIGGEAQ